MPPKEAKARIKINKLLEVAGWRFFDSNGDKANILLENNVRITETILDELGVKTKCYEKNYYLADSIEAVSTICSKTVKAGVKIFNLISAEDLMIRKNRICGLVLNWTAVEMAKLHVDPITMAARFVVDATGHAAEVVRLVEKKSGVVLKTKTGKVMGEKSMWAEMAEDTIVKNSKEVAPGLYTCGMCANAVFGGPRMGPIFGGMLLSGEKVAKDLAKRV